MCIAVALLSRHRGNSSLALGNNSTQANGAAFGSTANSTGSGSIAVGPAVQATAAVLAIGDGAHASQTGALAIGLSAQSGPGVNSIAIGTNTIATSSVAVGAAAMASNGGVAYGDSAGAAGSLATALGPNASTTAPNAVAIGSGSVANEDNTVSVGAPGHDRRIAHVAAGVRSDRRRDGRTSHSEKQRVRYRSFKSASTAAPGDKVGSRPAALTRMLRE
jgi:YadA head domain repeat (2 copies)